VVKPILLLILQVLFIYYCLSQPQFSFYLSYNPTITLAIRAILLIYVVMIAIGWTNGSQTELNRRNVNIMALLKAPEFPVLEDICPECLAY
jgi:asparagine N-glycosylation enzyme membrane subunit Stt3